MSVHPSKHQNIHLRIHFIIHPPIYSPIHQPIHLSTQLYLFFLIEKIMQKRTNDSCNLFSKSDSSQHFLHYPCKLIQSSIYLLINLFNHIFICSFTHSTNHPTINTTPRRRPPPCPCRRLPPPCLCGPPCRRPCPCPPPCSRPLTRVLLLVLLHLQKL